MAVSFLHSTLLCLVHGPDCGRCRANEPQDARQDLATNAQRPRCAHSQAPIGQERTSVSEAADALGPLSGTTCLCACLCACLNEGRRAVSTLLSAPPSNHHCEIYLHMSTPNSAIDGRATSLAQRLSPTAYTALSCPIYGLV
jgi:hypothetical protein